MTDDINHIETMLFFALVALVALVMYTTGFGKP